MDTSLKLNRIKPLLLKTAQDSKNWKFPVLPSGLDVVATPVTIAFLNQHGVNTALSNNVFYDFLIGSQFLLRDGIGAKIALKIFGLPKTENLNGTDLITRLVAHYNGFKLAIFGASDEAISACRQKLEAEGMKNIIAAENGFHDDDFYLSLCKELQPEIIILCMGMPRQEILAAKLKNIVGLKLIVCGGGWADFYSGIKVRAPEWVRKCSLEWAHRLMKEPKRLGKRYTIDIVYFLAVIFLAKWKKA